MPANLQNSAVFAGLEKVSFHSNPKKGNAKECSNYCTIALISHASKAMLKILEPEIRGPRTFGFESQQDILSGVPETLTGHAEFLTLLPRAKAVT